MTAAKIESLSNKDKSKALKTVSLIKVKICRKIKGWTYANNGSRQRNFVKTEESFASPTAPRESILILIDKEGTNFFGLNIEWNYKNCHVDTSMPHNVAKTLSKYNYPPPVCPQYTTYPWAQPAYGQKIQYAPTKKV